MSDENVTLRDRLVAGRESYERRTRSRCPEQLTSLLGVDSFWAAERKLLASLPDRFQTDGRIDRPQDLEAIVLWNTPRSVGLVRENSRPDVQRVTEAAFAEDSPEAKLATLTELEGIGPSIATAVLTFSDPESYTPMNAPATTALQTYGRWSGSTGATIAEYESYITVCREIAASTGLSLRDVDRGLYADAQFDDDRR